jgi:hypothetical protein
VIGNAAEYVSAMYFARKNQMGLAVSITVGSTIQISLMVAPVLVIVSALMGQPMNLVFTSPLELVAIGAVVFAVNAIAHDGETTWFEGVCCWRSTCYSVGVLLRVSPDSRRFSRPARIPSCPVLRNGGHMNRSSLARHVAAVTTELLESRYRLMRQAQLRP